jgi:hypothetical protein
MQWVRERTSIPVPKILAYGLDQSHALGAHMLLEKARVHFLRSCVTAFALGL